MILERESPGKGEGTGRPGEGRGRGAGPEDYSAQEGKERKEEERDSSRGEVVSAGFALVGSKHRKVSLVCFSSVRFGLVCSVADEQVWFFQGICSECSVIASRPPFRRQKVSQFWVGRERERERESFRLGFAKVVNLMPPLVKFVRVTILRFGFFFFFPSFSCFGFYFVFSAWRICGAGIFEV